MPSTLPIVAPARHLSRLENLPTRQAKADLKKVEDGWRAQVGRAIGRALKLADMSQKEAAGAMERDPAQVARWIAGSESHVLSALFAVEALRGPLVIALAGLADDIDVTTTISIRRRTA